MSLWKLLHPVSRKVIGFVRGTKAEALRAGQRVADQNGAAVILNPQVTPRVGEIWRGIKGDRCRILKVVGRQVTVLQLDSGHRVTSDLADFLATYKPPRVAWSSAPNPKRKGRKKRASARRSSGSARAGAQRSRGRPNPPRLSRKIRRATRSGRFVKAQHYQARSTSRAATRFESSRRASRRRPNPKGRNAVTAYIALRRDGEPGYTWALKRGIITVASGDPVRTISEAQAQVRRAVQDGGFILKSTVHDSRRTPNRRTRKQKGRKRASRARRSHRSARAASRGVARRNPRSEMDRARDTYRMWSELEPGKVSRVSAPARMPRAAAKLGDLVSVVYESDKYDGEAKLYEHKFKRPRPVLAADPDGRHMLIVGGPKVKITADGLVN